MKQLRAVWILSREERSEGGTVLAVFDPRPTQRKVAETLKPYATTVGESPEAIAAAVWKHGKWTEPVHGVDSYTLVRWKLS